MTFEEVLERVRVASRDPHALGEVAMAVELLASPLWLDDRRAAALRNDLADTLSEFQPELAVRLLHHAFTHLSRSDDPEARENAAVVLQNLATIQDRQGAVEPTVTALAAREALSGPESEKAVELRTRLVDALVRKGDLARAESVLTKAVETFEAIRSPLLGDALETLAVFLQRCYGASDRASVYLERARNVGQRDPIKEARRLIEVANLYAGEGWFQHGARAASDAVALLTRERPESLELGRALIAHVGLLSEAASSLQTRDVSRPQLVLEAKRGIALLVADLGTGHAEVGDAYLLLARLHYANDGRERGGDVLDLAIEIHSSCMDGPQLAAKLSTAASYAWYLGHDEVRALTLYGRSASHLGNAVSRDAIETLSSFGGFLLSRRPDEACAVLWEALAREERWLLTTRGTASVFQQTGALTTELGGLMKPLFQLRDNESEELIRLRATTAVLRTARETDECAASARAWSRSAPALESLRESLSDWGEIVIDSVTAGTVSPQARERVSELVLATRCHEEGLRGPRTDSTPVDLEHLLDELMARLDENEALIVFSVVQEVVAWPVLVERKVEFGGNHRQYFAHVIRRDGTEQVVLPTSHLLDQIRALQSLRGKNSRDVKVGAKMTSPPPLGPLSALYAAVFAPLEPLLHGCKRVYIVPEGLIHFVPFHALHDDRGYLIDRMRIVTLPSARVLLDGRRASGRGVLVFTDPDLHGPGDGAWANVFRALPRLTGAKREGEAILASCPDATVYTGSEAVRSRLLELESPAVLHVASHGLTLSASDSESANLGFYDPAVRSALALAPERRGGHTRRALTAAEFSTLDLAGTELVVLSACETGLGEAEFGRGVLGFQRAAFVAGASSVMASLFRIDDDATEFLMREFYRRLSQGHGRADALQDAALATRDVFPEPWKWASFTLLGRNDPVRW